MNNHYHISTSIVLLISVALIAFVVWGIFMRTIESESFKGKEEYLFNFNDSSLVFKWVNDGDTLQYTVKRDGTD